MSPIPLGFWATAGADAGGGAAMELIATSFGTGSNSTVTFSSIPQTYKHLQIRYVSRTTGTGTSGDTLSITFNGDTGSSYSRHYLQGDGTSISSTGGGTVSSMSYQFSVGQTSTANVFAPGIVDILDYASTSKNKAIRAMSANQSPIIRMSSGIWINTNAISSIALTTSGSHVAAARYSLYGIKG